MSVFSFLCFAFFPFVFSVVFFFFLVCEESLSLRSILFATLFSFLSVVTSSSLQLLLSFLFPSLLRQTELLTILFDSFVYSGVVEEVTKFFSFYCFLVFCMPLNVKCLADTISLSDEKYRKQLLMLAMFFASCFAGFENIAYMVFNINTLTIRLISATLFHIFVAPYYLRAFSNTKDINLSFIIIPVLLHGMYNMFIILGGAFFLFSFIIIFFLFVHTYQTTSFHSD